MDLPKTFSVAATRNLLRDITMCRYHICTLSKWICDHREHQLDIVQIWEEVFMTSDSDEKKQALLYVVDDVLRRCKIRRHKEYRSMFAMVLCNALSKLANECLDMHILRTICYLVQIWQVRKYFSMARVRFLHDMLARKLELMEFSLFHNMTYCNNCDSTIQTDQKLENIIHTMLENASLAAKSEDESVCIRKIICDELSSDAESTAKYPSPNNSNTCLKDALSTFKCSKKNDNNDSYYIKSVQNLIVKTTTKCTVTELRPSMKSKPKPSTRYIVDVDEDENEDANTGTRYMIDQNEGKSNGTRYVINEVKNNNEGTRYNMDDEDNNGTRYRIDEVKDEYESDNEDENEADDTKTRYTMNNVKDKNKRSRYMVEENEAEDADESEIDDEDENKYAKTRYMMNEVKNKNNVTRYMMNEAKQNNNGKRYIANEDEVEDKNEREIEDADDNKKTRYEAQNNNNGTRYIRNAVRDNKNETRYTFDEIDAEEEDEDDNINV